MSCFEPTVMRDTVGQVGPPVMRNKTPIVLAQVHLRDCVGILHYLDTIFEAKLDHQNMLKRFGANGSART